MKKIKNFIKNEIILSLLFGLWIFIILLFAEILFNYYEYNNLENKIKNKLKYASNVTIIYQIEENIWKGLKNIQLVILDLV